jgi:hypothetical protein
MKSNTPNAGHEPRNTDPENHIDDRIEPAAEPEPETAKPVEEPVAPSIEGESSSSEADVLVQIAVEESELFHDRVDTPYARIGTGTVMRVHGSGYSRWLQSLFRRHTKRAATPSSLKAAIHQIAATACFDGDQQLVHLRVAEASDSIILHLGHDDARSVQVSRSGHKVGIAPVAFEKKKHTQILPELSSVRSLAALGQLFNHGGESNLKLITGWLLMALKETGPKPILILQGPPGSAKTSMTEALKFLVDPTVPLLRTMPTSERDLAVAAANHWVLAFDNLSYVKENMSNALCRLSTGAGFGTRALYTDDEEVVFEYIRPVILNGLDAIATRQDLLSRSIVIRLPEIPKDRRLEKEVFWSRFEEARPEILGALLEATSSALANRSEVSLDGGLPRMADFASWVTAAEPALGWPAGSFLEAFEENNGEALKTSLEGSLLAEKVLQALADGVELQGTPADILSLLALRVSHGDSLSKAWPKNAQGMSRQLTLLNPALREFGVVVGESHAGRGREKRRWLSITQIEDGDEESES